MERLTNLGVVIATGKGESISISILSAAFINSYKPSERKFGF
ncbi:MAG: hypothetical protein ACXVHR_09090 [Methanobacterium sp.]